jgi:hypothetical protein
MRKEFAVQISPHVLKIRYGASGNEVVATLSMPPTSLPRDAKPPKKSESKKSTGGWPQKEIDFPGWEGRCDIAELSGKAVSANPELFIREFILKKRPVILRDYLRFDKVERRFISAEYGSLLSVMYFKKGAETFAQTHDKRIACTRLGIE